MKSSLTAVLLKINKSSYDIILLKWAILGK